MSARYCSAVLHGTQKEIIRHVPQNGWPLFIYDEELMDKQDLKQGLLRGPMLLAVSLTSSHVTLFF